MSDNTMVRSDRILIIFMLYMMGPPAHAMIEMTNEEVKQEIIKGALRDYEAGQCPSEYVMRKENPVHYSESSAQNVQNSSQQVTKRGSQVGEGIGFGGGYYPTWSIMGAVGQSEETHNSQSQGGSKSESKSYTENPGKCTCPCPYSVDINGKECGNASVYFQYADGDPNKIPCYPQDIQDWQITEYRNQYNIPVKGLNDPPK